MKERLFTLESPDGRHRLTMTQEPPRRRTVIIRNGRTKQIQTPWIQYMRVYSRLWRSERNPYLYICGSRNPMKTPDDKISYVSMPHTTGSFCMGGGESYLGLMEIEEIFWNTAFVDGVVKDTVDLVPAQILRHAHPLLPSQWPYRMQAESLPATPRNWIDYMVDSDLVVQMNEIYVKTPQYKRVVMRATQIRAAQERYSKEVAKIYSFEKAIQELEKHPNRARDAGQEIARYKREIDKLVPVREEAKAALVTLQADLLGKDL